VEHSLQTTSSSAPARPERRRSFSIWPWDNYGDPRAGRHRTFIHQIELAAIRGGAHLIFGTTLSSGYYASSDTPHPRLRRAGPDNAYGVSSMVSAPTTIARISTTTTYWTRLLPERLFLGKRYRHLRSWRNGNGLSVKPEQGSLAGCADHGARGSNLGPQRSPLPMSPAGVQSGRRWCSTPPGEPVELAWMRASGRPCSLSARSSVGSGCFGRAEGVHTSKSAPPEHDPDGSCHTR